MGIGLQPQSPIQWGKEQEGFHGPCCKPTIAVYSPILSSLSSNGRLPEETPMAAAVAMLAPLVLWVPKRPPQQPMEASQWEGDVCPPKSSGPVMGFFKSALAIWPEQTWEPLCWDAWPNREDKIQQWRHEIILDFSKNLPCVSLKPKTWLPLTNKQWQPCYLLQSWCSTGLYVLRIKKSHWNVTSVMIFLGLQSYRQRQREGTSRCCLGLRNFWASKSPPKTIGSMFHCWLVNWK